MNKRIQKSNSLQTLFPKVQGYSGKKKILSLSLSRVRPNKYGVILLFYHVGGTQIGTLLDPDKDHSSIRTSQQIERRYGNTRLCIDGDKNSKL